jgi:hypothetical protein
MVSVPTAATSAVAVVKVNTKLLGTSPATKVLGTADVYVTEVGAAVVVDTSVDTNSKARKIIVWGWLVLVWGV